MKKIKLTFIALIFVLNLYSQKDITKEDSINYELKIEHFDSLFAQSEIYYKNITDSLKQELVHYKAKEDFYVAALDDQSDQYILIVSGLFALLGLVSFNLYKLELRRLVKKTGKQIKKQNDNIEAFKKEINILNLDLSKSSGNSYWASSTFYQKSNMYDLAFTYGLASARDYTNCYTIKNSNPEHFVSKNKFDYEKSIKAKLKIITEIFDLIKKSDKYKPSMKGDTQTNNELLDKIAETNTEEVKDLVAELRIGLKNYLKE